MARQALPGLVRSMPSRTSSKQTPRAAAPRSARKPTRSAGRASARGATQPRGGRSQASASRSSRASRATGGPGGRAGRSGKTSGNAAAKPAVRQVRKARPTAKPSRPSGRPQARALREGFVAHTELVSRDPEATMRWCADVLGWRFGEPMPTPNGAYHMWSFGDNQGGGIRRNNEGEPAGAIPYCETNDLRGTYERALQAGAQGVLAPQEVPGAGGAIAIVQAPGGPPIGFWGKL